MRFSRIESHINFHRESLLSMDMLGANVLFFAKMMCLDDIAVEILTLFFDT